MSSNEREREYQKRRYDEWQKRLDQKKTERAKRNRVIAAVASAVAVFGIAGGVLWLTTGDDDATTAAPPVPSASSSPSAQPSPSPSESASPSPSTKNPCPPSTAKSGDPNAKSWDTAPPVGDTASHTYTLTLATSCGDVTAKLDGAKAPKAVSSTVFLAENGFYDDTPCHRLTTEGIYVLQCGDPTGSGSGTPGYQYGPVENAPKDQLYPAGTIAMARATEETSQGSQFFIVYKDSPIPGNYTVLGQVTDGLDVVQKIADGGVVPGGPGGTSDGSPARPISIKTATVEQN